MFFLTQPIITQLNLPRILRVLVNKNNAQYWLNYLKAQLGNNCPEL